ncbi:MAG: YceI family protein [Sulfurovum sp.]|nr:YceI family protein [Sulfurovum sp.]
MKKLLFVLMSTGAILLAKTGCTLVQSGKLNVLWEAYKTPNKIGVKGKMTSVAYIPHQKEGKNFKELFVGSKVAIDTTKVDSGNSVRDQKLVKFFFAQMSQPKITGEILSIKANPHTKGKPRTGKMEVSFTMNSKTVKTVLDYHYEKEEFKAQGNIDLLDFAAGQALASINKACYNLHKGKTWSDISIGFITHIKATLCSVEKK